MFLASWVPKNHHELHSSLIIAFWLQREESGNYKMLAVEARRYHTAVTVPKAASRAVAGELWGILGGWLRQIDKNFLSSHASIRAAILYYFHTVDFLVSGAGEIVKDFKLDQKILVHFQWKTRHYLTHPLNYLFCGDFGPFLIFELSLC